MSKRMTKLLLVASALVLGACNVDHDITAPSGSDRTHLHYDIQVNNDQSRQDVVKNQQRKRYAMAAS